MQVSAEKIEKLDQLVSKYIEKDKKISHVEITRLTAPGENFGSTILKVDLLLEDKNGVTSPLSVVAKLIPETEFFQKVFNISISFKMEVAFYTTIIPTLQQFQKEQGVRDVVDFFPKFYGSRLNLTGGNELDGNAVLLLENLKTSGYQNLDRHVGCDLENAKFILKDLAKFHAVPLALKVLRSYLFEIKLKKNMACFTIEREQHYEPIDRCTLGILEENDECKPFLDLYQKAFEISTQKQLTFREPFATLSHDDMWVNNFMVKIENGKIVKNNFVDFQNYTYDSPVKDLLYLLFTSVQTEVLKNHLDDLINLYHEEFIKTLTDLRCPTKDFSYENLIDEIKYFGISEMYHILVFSALVVFGKKGGETLDEEMGAPKLPTKDDVPEFVKERLCWVFLEFKKRHWLQN